MPERDIVETSFELRRQAGDGLGSDAVEWEVGQLAANAVDRGEAWQHRAACLDQDPELFFPIGNKGPALLQIKEAKAVCKRCPVIEDCRKYALESGQEYGVWGGISEDERRALKGRMKRQR